MTLTLLLIACDPGTSQTIGADGGTLQVDGATLDVPAGALSEDVDITLTLLEDPVEAGYAATPDHIALDVAWELLPHGTTFDTPVTLTLDVSKESEEWVMVRVDDESDDTWEAIGPLTFGDGTVSVELDTFSGGGLGEADDCPCWTGRELRALYAATAPWDGTWVWDGYYKAPPDRLTTVTLVNWVHPQPLFRAAARDRYPLCAVVVYTQRVKDAAGDMVPWTQIGTGEYWYGIEQGGTDEQLDACQDLLVSFSKQFDHALIFDGTSLPTGANVTLAHDGNDIVVPAGDTATTTVALQAGDPYSVTLHVEPDGYDCSLSDNATGTITDDVQVIEVTCVEETASSCQLDWTSESPLPASASWTDLTCELQLDAGAITGILVRDAALPGTFDIEGDWANYTGTVFAHVAVDQGNLADPVLFAWDTEGRFELDAAGDNAAFNTVSLDTSAQTFNVSVTGGLETASDWDGTNPDASGAGTVVNVNLRGSYSEL